MSHKHYTLRRTYGEKRYKKLYVIATEGAVTEPQYFECLYSANINIQKSITSIKYLKSNSKSSPTQTLDKMTAYLKEEKLRSGDEAWIVVDKDQWTDDQLTALHAWAKKDNRFGFALSNPKFEYWLLLHFDDGANISSSSDCSDRLRKHLPGYNKKIDCRKFTRNNILAAIDRAKRRDNPPCNDWPRTPGGTTVYKLVENILAAETQLI